MSLTGQIGVHLGQLESWEPMANNRHLRISDLFSCVKKIEVVLENSRELKVLVKKAQVGSCFLDGGIEVLVPRHN